MSRLRVPNNIYETYYIGDSLCGAIAPYSNAIDWAYPSFFGMDFNQAAGCELLDVSNSSPTVFWGNLCLYGIGSTEEVFIKQCAIPTESIKVITSSSLQNIELKGNFQSPSDKWSVATIDGSIATFPYDISVSTVFSSPNDDGSGNLDIEAYMTANQNTFFDSGTIDLSTTITVSLSIPVAGYYNLVWDPQGRNDASGNTLAPIGVVSRFKVNPTADASVQCDVDAIKALFADLDAWVELKAMTYATTSPTSSVFRCPTGYTFDDLTLIPSALSTINPLYNPEGIAAISVACYVPLDSSEPIETALNTTDYVDYTCMVKQCQISTLEASTGLTATHMDGVTTQVNVPTTGVIIRMRCPSTSQYFNIDSTALPSGYILPTDKSYVQLPSLSCGRVGTTAPRSPTWIRPPTTTAAFTVSVINAATYCVQYCDSSATFSDSTLGSTTFTLPVGFSGKIGDTATVSSPSVTCPAGVSLISPAPSTSSINIKCDLVSGVPNWVINETPSPIDESWYSQFCDFPDPCSFNPCPNAWEICTTTSVTMRTCTCPSSADYSVIASNCERNPCVFGDDSCDAASTACATTFPSSAGWQCDCLLDFWKSSSADASDPCVSSSCTDGVQSGDETGVDCGGSCTSCVACGAPPNNGDATYSVSTVGVISSAIYTCVNPAFSPFPTSSACTLSSTSAWTIFSPPTCSMSCPAGSYLSNTQSSCVQDTLSPILVCPATIQLLILSSGDSTAALLPSLVAPVLFYDETWTLFSITVDSLPAVSVCSTISVTPSAASAVVCADLAVGSHSLTLIAVDASGKSTTCTTAIKVWPFGSPVVGEDAGVGNDECVLGLHECDTTSSCTHISTGGYTCSCPSIYAVYNSTSRKCELPNFASDPDAFPPGVNECETGINACLPLLAECKDRENGYKCVCKEGYVGDGVSSCNNDGSNAYIDSKALPVKTDFGVPDLESVQNSAESVFDNLKQQDSWLPPPEIFGAIGNIADSTGTTRDYFLEATEPDYGETNKTVFTISDSDKTKIADLANKELEMVKNLTDYLGDTINNMDEEDLDESSNEIQSAFDSILRAANDLRTIAVYTSDATGTSYTTAAGEYLIEIISGLSLPTVLASAAPPRDKIASRVVSTIKTPMSSPISMMLTEGESSIAAERRKSIALLSTRLAAMATTAPDLAGPLVSSDGRVKVALTTVVKSDDVRQVDLSVPVMMSSSRAPIGGDWIVSVPSPANSAKEQGGVSDNVDCAKYVMSVVSWAEHLYFNAVVDVSYNLNPHMLDGMLSVTLVGEDCGSISSQMEGDDTGGQRFVRGMTIIDSDNGGVTGNSTTSYIRTAEIRYSNLNVKYAPIKIRMPLPVGASEDEQDEIWEKSLCGFYDTVSKRLNYDGCLRVKSWSRENYIDCECSHLTDFGALFRSVFLNTNLTLLGRLGSLRFDSRNVAFWVVIFFCFVMVIIFGRAIYRDIRYKITKSSLHYVYLNDKRIIERLLLDDEEPPTYFERLRACFGIPKSSTQDPSIQSLKTARIAIDNNNGNINDFDNIGFKSSKNLHTARRNIAEAIASVQRDRHLGANISVGSANLNAKPIFTEATWTAESPRFAVRKLPGGGFISVIPSNESLSPRKALSTRFATADNVNRLPDDNEGEHVENINEFYSPRLGFMTSKKNNYNSNSSKWVPRNTIQNNNESSGSESDGNGISFRMHTSRNSKPLDSFNNDGIEEGHYSNSKHANARSIGVDEASPKLNFSTSSLEEEEEDHDHAKESRSKVESVSTRENIFNKEHSSPFIHPIILKAAASRQNSAKSAQTIASGINTHSPYELGNNANFSSRASAVASDALKCRPDSAEGTPTTVADSNISPSSTLGETDVKVSENGLSVVVSKVGFSQWGYFKLFRSVLMRDHPISGQDIGFRRSSVQQALKYSSILIGTLFTICVFFGIDEDDYPDLVIGHKPWYEVSPDIPLIVIPMPFSMSFLGPFEFDGINITLKTLLVALFTWVLAQMIPMFIDYLFTIETPFVERLYPFRRELRYRVDPLSGLIPVDLLTQEEMTEWEKKVNRRAVVGIVIGFLYCTFCMIFLFCMALAIGWLFENDQRWKSVSSFFFTALLSTVFELLLFPIIFAFLLTLFIKRVLLKTDRFDRIIQYNPEVVAFPIDAAPRDIRAAQFKDVSITDVVELTASGNESSEKTLKALHNAYKVKETKIKEDHHSSSQNIKYMIEEDKKVLNEDVENGKAVFTNPQNNDIHQNDVGIQPILRSENPSEASPDVAPINDLKDL